MNCERDIPLKYLYVRYVRTNSSHQTWSVSQNQIRKSEQDVQFCGLFSQASIPRLSVLKQAFHYAKDVFHFCPNG